MNSGKRMAAKSEEEVLENTKCRTVQEKLGQEEVNLRNGGWSGESRNISLEYGVKIAGQEFSGGSGRRAYSESKACRKVKQKRKKEIRQQQRMKVMKDMTRKIRAKERFDAHHSWWVSEFLAADCRKAWLHSGWEDTMQRWFDWLHEMKKKTKQKEWKWSTKKISRMIRCAEGSTGVVHENYQANGVERRRTDSAKGRRIIEAVG